MSFEDASRESIDELTIEDIVHRNSGLLTEFAAKPRGQMISLDLRLQDGVRADTSASVTHATRIHTDCDEENRAMLAGLYQLAHMDERVWVEEKPTAVGFERNTWRKSPHGFYVCEAFAVSTDPDDSWQLFSVKVHDQDYPHIPPAAVIV